MNNFGIHLIADVIQLCYRLVVTPGWQFQMSLTQEGWLYKRKPNGVHLIESKNWDRRFFRIDGMKLYWFKTPHAVKPRKKDGLSLSNITEVRIAIFPKTPKPHHASCGFQITAQQEKGVRNYWLVAETIDGAQEWVIKLNETIAFYRNRGWSLPDGNHRNDSQDSV